MDCWASEFCIGPASVYRGAGRFHGGQASEPLADFATPPGSDERLATVDRDTAGVAGVWAVMMTRTANIPCVAATKEPD